jgi:hypothetical protein
MVEVVDLAYFIIKRTNNTNNPISHLQLQKLLFILQKINLEKNKVPLFNEKIYAWDFGTMIKEVYNEFCVFSSLKIILSDFEYGKYLDKINKIKLEDFLLDYIDEFSQKKSWEISSIKNLTWEKIYDNGKGYKKLITLDDMKV